MNLVLKNVQPSHIPVFRELAKVLNIKMRKEENVEKRKKRKKSSEKMKEAGLE